VPYNLTEGQKDLLRSVVREVRAGNLREEFWVHWLNDIETGIFAEYKGEHPPPVTQGALDALAASGLILGEPHYGQYQETSRRCTLLGNAYTAVDSDFASPEPQHRDSSRPVHGRPLAFISHDSRDKADIALPLALMLEERDCPVWYADFSLRVGDSLIESIERGLTETRKCILILTPNFLNNKGWTKREFNSVFTREVLEKRNVILPVWHGVTQQQVYDYSPSLADKYALIWSAEQTQKEKIAPASRSGTRQHLGFATPLVKLRYTQVLQGQSYQLNNAVM
jgi:hypothetical protein